MLYLIITRQTKTAESYLGRNRAWIIIINQTKKTLFTAFLSKLRLQGVNIDVGCLCDVIPLTFYT